MNEACARTAVSYVWHRGEISMGNKRFVEQGQHSGGLGIHQTWAKSISSNGQEQDVHDTESRHASYSKSESFLDTFYAWRAQHIMN